MPLNPRTAVALIIFLVLWILWCFFVINEATPWVELHLNMWRWVASWILCLLPLMALCAVLITRVKKNRL